jgi:hypothetical protein
MQQATGNSKIGGFLDSERVRGHRVAERGEGVRDRARGASIWWRSGVC